jgi:leucyl/phenylalanyl-tRNA--protein transferase
VKRLFAAKREVFPDPATAHANGVVAVGDDLSVERLLEAYSFGIFPWPQEGYPTLWFCPLERGVIDFSEFHVSRSLAKFQRQHEGEFKFSFNTAFSEVIQQCAESPRPGQDGTWINENILEGYQNFHRAGYAHSFEVWRGDDLVGGIYGVYVAGVFSGESMFFLEPNASKVALVRLVDFLRSAGLNWMDIQMVTPALEQMGGKYISRMEFLARLEREKFRARQIEFKTV